MLLRNYERDICIYIYIYTLLYSTLLYSTWDEDYICRYRYLIYAHLTEPAGRHNGLDTSNIGYPLPAGQSRVLYSMQVLYASALLYIHVLYIRHGMYSRGLSINNGAYA